jgi:pilus assembly protein CpaB
MSRNRLVIGLAVALVAGLFAARYVHKQIQSARVVTSAPTGQIVVAAERIRVGARLQRINLREVKWPADQRPKGSCARIDDCVDRPVVTPLVEGEPVLEDKLLPKEAGAGLAVALPEGQRAVSVRVDDVVAVAGFVVPGTMVDVLVTGDVPGGNNSVTKAVLENVRVLAAGQKVEQDRDGKPQTVTVVTLQVDPEQANTLTMASTEGKIHLALRNTIDTKEASPPPVYKTTLFSGGSPPAPPSNARRVAPAPAPPKAPEPYVVEVIRGDKRESQAFSNQSNHVIGEPNDKPKGQ